MTFKNLRFVNEFGGIQATHTGGGDVYLEPGSAQHVAALAGDYGTVGAYQARGGEPAAPDLNAAQFEYLLANTGFGDVWDALEADAKGGDRRQFAALRAERKRRTFKYDRVLQVVARFRDVAAQIAPGVDLSDSAIHAAWLEAENWGGL